MVNEYFLPLLCVIYPNVKESKFILTQEKHIKHCHKEVEITGSKISFYGNHKKKEEL